MTHVAILTTVSGLEAQGWLERDPLNGGVIMACMAMDALGALRQSAQSTGPGFSWEAACSCCAAHGMGEGEVWASVGRLMASGYLHQGADLAFIRLCPQSGVDDSAELQQALSGAYPDDGSGAWARSREYSIWAIALMRKNGGKEEGARARAECALGWFHDWSTQ